MKLLQFVKHMIPEEIKDSLKILYYKSKLHYRKEKKTSQCVILFLVSRTNIFSSVQTVFEEANQDTDIEAYLVALPDRANDKSNMDNSDVLQFCYGIAKDRVIDCFDNTRQFISLETLHPDYIFLGIPYEEEYPIQYRFSRLASFAKLCFVPYGYLFIGGVVLETVENVILLAHLSYLFADGPVTYKYCHKKLSIYEKIHGKIVYSLGFPRFDAFTDNIKSTNKKEEKPHTIIAYFPRWTTIESEKNGHEPSSFMLFKDRILEFAKKNQEYTIIIRPHPLLLYRFIKCGMLQEKEVTEYKEQISSLQNVILDESSDYRSTLLSSDIMIADYSSTIAEFLLTGRPVLYFGTDNNISDEHKPIFQKMYHIQNWDDAERIIIKLKKDGDWMYEERMTVVNPILRPRKELAGKLIVQTLKKNNNEEYACTKKTT